MKNRASAGAWAVTLGLALGSACGGSSATSSGTDGGAGADGGSGSSSGGGSGSSSGSGSGSSSGSGSGSGGDSGPGSIHGPHAFYTDLTSGPGTGGEGGNGAYVTLAGRGFGASRGTSTVTIGGGGAAGYPIWTDTRVTFQLGAAAKTGDVVVHVGGASSNALPFTVRAGQVYFVTSSGDDGHDGSFASPWKTIPKAKNTIAAGDVAYVGTHAGDAVSQTTVDASSSYDCALGMSVNDGTNGGTAGMPKALVVYPGATATIGVESGIERGILTPAISGTFDDWVIAGFTLRGAVEALDLEGPTDGWRVVNNDLSCPNGTGLSGCATGNPTYLAFYGNVVHDAAANVAADKITKYYHGVYWGSSHVDMGWNTVRDGKTCRAIQFHDTGGPNEFDLHVHDNVIHGTVCDGLNFATVDPSQGTVEAYDNVIYDVGLGPDPADGASDYAGIYVAGETDSGAPGSGAVQIYGNTLYGCGAWTKSADSGAFNDGGGNPKLTMNLVDNLIVSTAAGEAYVAKDSGAGLVTGSHNLFFGGGAAPSFLTANVTGDPKLAAPTTFDFHLTAGSAAVGAGIAIPATTDLDGEPRPLAGSWDLGAYEYAP